MSKIYILFIYSQKNKQQINEDLTAPTVTGTHPLAAAVINTPVAMTTLQRWISQSCLVLQSLH